MSLATIYLKDGTKTVMKQSGDRTASIRAFNVWHNNIPYSDLTDKEKQIKPYMKRVVLPPSWAAEVKGYEPASKPLDKTPLAMDVRGLDDIDTDPDKKRDPTIPTADIYEKRYH